MEMIDKLDEFLRDRYNTEIINAAKEEKSIVLDFAQLDRFDPLTADQLLEDPQNVLNELNRAASNIAFGEKIVARVKNLPPSRNIRIRNLRAKHIGKLLCIDATIKSASEVKPRIYEAIFECPECNAKITIPQETNVLQKPGACECGRRGDFNLVEKKLHDIRWLNGIEPFELTTGEQPGEVMIFLKDDLTTPKMQKKTDPGNRLKFVGLLKELPKHIKGKLSTRMDMYFEANYLEPSEIKFEELDITEADEKLIKGFANDINIYEKLKASIASGIYGFDEIKEALALQLFGGVVHVLPDKSRIRGNIHILLTGDPGCLVGNERVVLGNGAIVEIQSLGKEHLQNIDLDVLTGEGGKKRGRATVFHIYKKQPILEVITESGKSIKGTYNHPLLCLHNDDTGIIRKWKRLDEIKIGDRLAVVTSIPCTVTKHLKTNFTPLKRPFGPRFSGKLPEYWDEDLAAFAGYIIGDGWVRKYETGFVVAEQEIDILEKLVEISENLFSKKTVLEKRRPKSAFIGKRNIIRKQELIYAYISSKDIASNLNFLREKRIPDLVFRSGNSVAASFLRWLYEADGSVFDKGRGSRSINLKSKSIELLRDVQILLLRFVIHSRIVGDNLMIRRGASILKFAKHIGFVSKKKRTRLAQLAKSAENFKRFKSQRSERVVRIIRHGREDVYDIEVPGSHRFIANGIISHNTGKTMLLKQISSIMPRGRYVSGSGVSGAGLCTTYDTLISLEDGSITEIGDFVEQHTHLLQKESDNIYCAEIDGPNVMSFSQDSLKICPKKITHVWKIKSPAKLIKIKTRLGKEIKVTRENPLPIIKNGTVVWKKAEDLEKREFLAAPRNLSHIKTKSSVMQLIDADAHLKNCSEPVLSLIQKIRSKSTIKSFVSENREISKNGLYWFWKNEKAAPKMSDLQKISAKTETALEEILPETLILSQKKGHTVSIPKYLNEDVLYFFGLIAGDGDIQKTTYGGRSLRFHSADKELLDKFTKISLSQFGIRPEFYKHPEKIAYLRINSKIVGKMAEKLGIPSGKNSGKLRITETLSSLPNELVAAYLRGIFDTDGYVSVRKTRGSNSVGMTTISKNFAYGILLLLLRFGIIGHIRERPECTSVIRGKKIICSKKYEIEIRGRGNLSLFKKAIRFGLSRKSDNLSKIISISSKENTNIDVIPEISGLLENARKTANLTSKDIFDYKNYSFEKGRINPSRNMLAKIVSRMKTGNNSEFLRQLDMLSNSDIFWDEITEIEEVDGEDFVYDITVEGEHSFVANGLIIHNTATVVKNETLGTWVLEAGALILCNQGLISIDEFDKMNRDDQIAMHEATSVETVSIAKASIVATLPAQTAVLAGANPKLGRFDPYLSVAEQIQIPETLLSRFDLKFAIKDKPDKVTDEKLADHVILSRTTPELIEPPIPVPLLRKYIAYARQITDLELTEEASKIIKDFYVDMRTRYTGEEIKTVSITLRQYEALLRLAEASAKVRLKRKVEREDAERAIRLMQYSLMQLGYDFETGRIDIDKIESGVTASKRRKITIVLEMLENLQKESKEVAVEDLKAEAETQGIGDIEEIIDRLKREGTIFEPRAGFVRRV